jgi:putative membrane protein
MSRLAAHPAPAAFGARAGADELSPQDFVVDAILAGLSEVELGRLALKKSSNPDVLGFARSMVEDQGKANQKLAAVAAKEGLGVPSMPAPARIALVRHLDSLEGPEFDRAYMRLTAEAQTSAALLFTYAAWISDRTVAEFARDTLPTIRQHKVLATRLNVRVN